MVEEIGGEYATESAEQVALPTHAGLRGEDAAKRAAIQNSDDDPDDDRHGASGEEAARHHVCQEPEDHPAGTEVKFVRTTEQPHAKPTYQRNDDEHGEVALDASSGNDQGKDGERDRVSDEVRPPGVQKWGEGDPPQSAEFMGADTKSIQPVRHDRVNGLDNPEQRNESNRETNPGIGSLPERRQRRSH